MATTTNFGWETPDDTDLVKDGAAAIRTLGSAIDTSLVDLKGGTTGQVLSKASNSDMDFSWAAAGATFSGANVRKASSPGDQTVSNGTWTTITFNSEDFDTDSYHSNTTNTGRLTVATAGYYRLQGQIQWSQDNTNSRQHRLYKNGATEISYIVRSQGSLTMGVSITAFVYLAANDYVEFQVYQDSGNQMSVSWTDGRTFFNIEKAG